ncbi:MAG: hypothetical protein AB8H86_11160 [Polyangiales bacterium]
MDSAQAAASWKAGTLRQDELRAMAEPLLQLARQNLKARRLEAASDYLELHSLADPTSSAAMKTRAALARARGQVAKANAYEKMASWV